MPLQDACLVGAEPSLRAVIARRCGPPWCLLSELCAALLTLPLAPLGPGCCVWSGPPITTLPASPSRLWTATK